MPIKLSHQAEADVRDVYRYGLLHFGIEQADTYNDGIFSVLALIEKYPGIGRLHTEYAPPLRIHLWRNHYLIYTEQPGHVLVVRILHCNSDLTYHLAIPPSNEDNR